jgi:biopolymer transport protein ExbD
LLYKPRKQVNVAISIAPLVDVVFLLIIFCMTVTQFGKLEAEPVTLPEATTGESLTRSVERRLIVNVTREGELVVARHAYTLTALETLLVQRLESVPAAQLTVLLRGDRDADWGSVRAVMRLCAASGVGNVRVAVLGPDA